VVQDGGQNQKQYEYGPFKESMTDCLVDISGCCKGLICPCIQWGENKKKMSGD